MSLEVDNELSNIKKDLQNKLAQKEETLRRLKLVELYKSKVKFNKHESFDTFINK
jgi:hypothetical protein